MQISIYANMKIRMGLLYVNILGQRNTLAKFRTIIMKDKSGINIYSQNIAEILAKIYIKEHILPILLINFIIYWQKQ